MLPSLHRDPLRTACFMVSYLDIGPWPPRDAMHSEAPNDEPPVIMSRSRSVSGLGVRADAAEPALKAGRRFGSSGFLLVSTRPSTFDKVRGMRSVFRAAALMSSMALLACGIWVAHVKAEARPSEASADAMHLLPPLAVTGPQSPVIMVSSKSLSRPVLDIEVLLKRELSSRSLQVTTAQLVQDAAEKVEKPLLQGEAWSADDFALKVAISSYGSALQPTLAQRLEGRMPAAPQLPRDSMPLPCGAGLLEVAGKRAMVIQFSNAFSPKMLARARDAGLRWRLFSQPHFSQPLWPPRMETHVPALSVGMSPLYQPLLDLLLSPEAAQESGRTVLSPMVPP